MPKLNNTKTIEDSTLAKINLIPPKNHLGDFESVKSDIIDLKRWVLPTDFILSQLKNIGDDDLTDFINYIKTPVEDDKKTDLINTIKSFFNENPVLTISLKDKNKINQIGVIIWYKKLSDDSGLIKIKQKDSKGKPVSFDRFILVNQNLDRSYGVQAENPRIKISSVINSILNYQLFSSCENQGRLIYDKPIFINDLIESGLNTFSGENIINRGYYDSPEYFGKGKKSAGDESAGDDESVNFDF